ncbi:MAG: hypothetical protein M3N13_03230 [Candidatus Eremiobacteraeota bacterium]|nr:hypothetical protein [Candidatus Eremiobacteraeota bacterium]
MSRSRKPQIFEWLFRSRYDFASDAWVARFDEATGTIPPEHRLVFAEEITKANVEVKAGLGHNQAANFSKDFLRNASRNTNWPEALRAAGWTVMQVTGKDPATGRLRNFVWQQYANGQSEPFPDEWPIPSDTADYDHYRVQSVSMSVPSKQILRLDEARLMQIAVELRVVESHFALHSPLNTSDFQVVHIDHLQTGMKQRRAEIDGLFLAQFESRGNEGRRVLHPVLIPVEAKRRGQSITSAQVVTQVEEAAALGVDCEQIVPLAMKQHLGGIFIFEYEPFDAAQVRPETLKPQDLIVVARSFYEIVPAMYGFGTHDIPAEPGDKDDG